MYKAHLLTDFVFYKRFRPFFVRVKDVLGLLYIIYRAQHNSFPTCGPVFSFFEAPKRFLSFEGM
jgi:hypothetical protein